MLKLTIKEKKIYGRLFIIFLCLLLTVVAFVTYKCFDIDYFTSENYKQIQFNFLSIDSILLGFMFTSLGIFVSASEHEAIKRESEYVKYDMLVTTMIVGLISISISMIFSIVSIAIHREIYMKLVGILIGGQFFLLSLGIILFVLVIFDSIYIVKTIRKHYTKK